MTTRNPQSLIKALPVEVRPDWMAKAACKRPGVDLSAFYAEHGDDVHAKASTAKAICAACPVVAPSLAYGDLISERWGTFGSLTAQERRTRRQALGRAA